MSTKSILTNYYEGRNAVVSRALKMESLSWELADVLVSLARTVEAETHLKTSLMLDQPLLLHRTQRILDAELDLADGLVNCALEELES
jgi:hypothetical protein